MTKTPPDPADLEKIKLALGLDFISYCTASSPDVVVARLRGESALPEAAEDVLAHLVLVYDQAQLVSTQTRTPIDLFWDFIGHWSTGIELSVANAIRSDAGGEIFEPHNDDRLTEALQQIAVNVYPLFLIPPSGEMLFPSISLTQPLLSYPISTFAVNAILGDEDLSRLHPGVSQLGDEGTEEPSATLTKLNVIRTVESIVTYAFNNAIHNLARIPSAEEACSEVVVAVTSARDLIRGRRVSLPVAVGLANLKVSSSAIIECDGIRLSEHVAAFDRWAPASLRKNRINLTSDQGQHEFSRGGDIALLVRQRCRLSIETGSGNGFSWKLAPVDNSELPAWQDTVCLAATLGLSNVLPVAVNPVWTTSFSPIGPMAPSWREINQAANVPLRVVSLEEMDIWKSWIQRIRGSGLSGIVVGARRIQLAIAERLDPVDSFVDSVIAWESLFGGGEMTLRISASLAWLLGENAARRQDLQREIATLYSRRSSIVHGSSQSNDRQLSESSNRALSIAIDALRAIYNGYPELIGMKAYDRSLQVMLQISSPADPAVAAESE